MPYLVNIGKRDVLFIDEIHRLNVKTEEFLYSVMEDFSINMITANGISGKALSMPVTPFTLIGATTLAGNLSSPLRDRFGIQLVLDVYTNKELVKIMENLASKDNIRVSQDGLLLIAQCSRGVPRICQKLFYCVRDFMDSKKCSEITRSLVQVCFKILKIDKQGLENIDRKYLRVLYNLYNGGPAGVNSIACSMDESPRTLQNMVEPFLLQKGYIIRTPGGRKIAPNGTKLLGEMAYV